MFQTARVVTIALLFLLLGAPSTQAATYTYHMTGTAISEECEYFTTTINLDKASYAPGENIVATGSIVMGTSGSCFGVEGVDLNATINTINKELFDVGSWTGSGTATFTAPTTPGAYNAAFTAHGAGSTWISNGISFITAFASGGTVTYSLPYSVAAPAAGVCGTANGKTYAYSASSYGSDTQCSSGVSSNAAFPAAGSSVSWTCAGVGGGASSPACSASRDGARADLRAGDVDQTTAVVNVGLKLSAPISNLGTAVTGTGFTYLFQRATNAAGTANVTDIGTGARGLSLGTNKTYTMSSTANVTPFPSVGTYWVRACADKSSAADQFGTINEAPPAANEINNCGDWEPITITAAPEPDLKGLGTTVSAASVGVGVPVTFTGQISNVGLATMPEYPAVFLIKNSVGATIGMVPAQTIYAHAAGLTTDVTGSYATSSPGTYRVLVVGNMNASEIIPAFPETIWTNNFGTPTTVNVTAIPPPTASISAVPSSVSYNGRPTLTWSSGGAVTSCSAPSGNWSNAGTLSGSGLSDPLTSNTTFTFQCSGPGGLSNLASASVTVGAGSCGSANGRSYPNGSTSYAPYAQCASGASDNPSFPSAGNTETWRCSGSPQCSASQAPAGCGVLSIPPITATPSRVKEGGTTRIDWGAVSGVTSSCVVSGTDGYNSGAILPVSCSTPPGTVNRTITTKTIYCMTCNGNTAAKRCVTVNVIPDFTEF